MLHYIAFASVAAVSLAGVIAITNVEKGEVLQMQKVGMTLLESVSPVTASHMPSPSDLLSTYMSKQKDEVKSSVQAPCQWQDVDGHCVANGD